MDTEGSKTRPTVELAKTQDERDEIFRLRYQIYVKEMGKNFAGADHSRAMLCDPLDDTSELLYVSANGQVAATLRVGFGDRTDLARYREIYALDRFSSFTTGALSVCSRLVVANDWRSSPIVGQLLCAAYELAREHGTLFNFCHCAASLVRLYECLGFRRYKENIEEPALGYRIPLVLILNDLPHMRATRSPLQRIARGMNNDPSSAEWFTHAFGAPASQINTRLMSTEVLWRFFSERLHDESVPLLRGLTAEESQRLLSAVSVIRCRTGDRPVRIGTFGEEMYVILSGVVDIRIPGDSGETSLATLGKGEIFGEMALLSETERTADVVALKDSELMILTQSQLRKVMKTMPEIAITVLFNLSLILCGRLRETTQNWVKSLGATGQQKTGTPYQTEEDGDAS